METKSSPQGTQPTRQAGLRAEKLLTSQGRRASATPILPAPPQPRGQTPGRVGRLCTWTDPSPFTLRLRVEGGCVPLWLALSADPVPSWSPSCSSFQGVVRFWLVLDLDWGQGSWSSTQISRDLIIKGSSCPGGEGFFFGGRGRWLEGGLDNPESLSYYHIKPLKLSFNFKHTIAIPNSRWVYQLRWSYQGGFSQLWGDMEKGVLKEE